MSLFKQLLLSSTLLLTLLFAACDRPEDLATAGKYVDGVFIVNEGTFNTKGSITWHFPYTGETVQDVFEQANNGAVLGQLVQSMTLYNGNAYVVVSGSNRIVVADAVTFKFKDTIGGLVLPRHFLPLDANTALVSQWGRGGLQGSVVKVDLRTNKVTATIRTGAGPDKMLLQPDGNVWVANSGGFGTDSTISVINPVTNTEVSRLRTGGKNPGSLARGVFNGSRTYAHCRGSFLDATPRGWVGSVGGVSDPGVLTVPYGDDLVSSPDQSRLYFATGSAVFVVDASGVRELFKQSAYGLACQRQSGDLYCLDAKNFQVAGEGVIYNPAGQVVGRFTTGVAPGELVFIR
jgi:hypothetical protein